MVKTMDAIVQPPPLYSGPQALFGYFLSEDNALTSHPTKKAGQHGLPDAVGGSLASAIPQSAYPLIPASIRDGLTCFYSGQPLPTPTLAPSRPADTLAHALGLGEPASASFSDVLEAVRSASVDILADTLPFCPAAAPTIQRLLLAQASAPAGHTVALHTSKDGGAGGDGRGAARGADDDPSAGGTGDPPRDPSGRFTRAHPPPPLSASEAGNISTGPDASDVLEVTAHVLAALRAPPPLPLGAPPGTPGMKAALEFSALATKASQVFAAVRAHQQRFPQTHAEYFRGNPAHASDLTALEPLVLTLVSSTLEAHTERITRLLTALHPHPRFTPLAADVDAVLAMELRLGQIGTRSPDPLEEQLQVAPIFQLLVRVVLKWATQGEGPEVAQLHAYLGNKKAFTLVRGGKECLLETYSSYRALAQLVERAGGRPSPTLILRAWVRALAAVLQPEVCTARIPDCAHPPSDLETIGFPSAANPLPLSFLGFAQGAVLAAGSLDPDAPVPPALPDALLACICRYQAATSILVAAAAAADGGVGGGRLFTLRDAADELHGGALITNSRCTGCTSYIPAISGFCHVCPRVLYPDAWVCCCSPPRIYAPTTAKCRSCSSSDAGRRPTAADLSACAARVRGLVRGAAPSPAN